jgi:putative FmdB family regulatory protein
MPLYEYQCTKCHHRFERIQKFSDPPITKCPECGRKVEQLLSAPAVQFKGSGWYVTDYGKGGTSKASSGSGDSPSKAESTAVEAASESAKSGDSSSDKPKKSKSKKHD